MGACELYTELRGSNKILNFNILQVGTKFQFQLAGSLNFYLKQTFKQEDILESFSQYLVFWKTFLKTLTFSKIQACRLFIDHTSIYIATSRSNIHNNIQKKQHTQQHREVFYTSQRIVALLSARNKSRSPVNNPIKTSHYRFKFSIADNSNSEQCDAV